MSTTVTLEEIARRLNLSAATVSRSLRHDPLIHPATRARVNETAAAMGYQGRARRGPRGGAASGTAPAGEAVTGAETWGGQRSVAVNPRRVLAVLVASGDLARAQHHGNFMRLLEGITAECDGVGALASLHTLPPSAEGLFGGDPERTPAIVRDRHCDAVIVTGNLPAGTDLPRLYASGEVACTGVHGANRLASNSLLEGLVFSNRAARHLRENDPGPNPACDTVPPFRPYRGRVRIADTASLRQRIQTAMTRYVGIVRSDDRLEKAETALSVIAEEVDALYATCRPTEDLLELRNLYLTAQLIIRSAEARHESRGLHYTTDYPEPVESERHDTVLMKRKRTDFLVVTE